MRIVTVYLGDTIPTHFWMHIRHLLKIQSNYQIDIVTSHIIASKPLSDIRLRYFVYKPQKSISKLLDELVMDTKFRNGFWRYSLERLFAVTQHHLEFPNQSLIHIESDVLVLKHFPFQTFESLEKLAWSRVNSDQGVAAIVYSPNVQASMWLSDQMQSIVGLAHNTDDMRVLGEISSKYPHLVDILPSLPEKLSLLKNESLNSTEAELESISHLFSTFRGVFDPAGIGIWLTGTEPRNSFGVTKKFDYKSNAGSKAFINPGRVNYNFNQNNGLSFESGGRTTQIYSLHIHSKNLKYFGENYEKHIYQDVKRSFSGKVQFEFSPKILLTLIVQNLKKGNSYTISFMVARTEKVKEVEIQKG